MSRVISVLIDFLVVSGVILFPSDFSISGMTSCHGMRRAVRQILLEKIFEKVLKGA